MWYFILGYVTIKIEGLRIWKWLNTVTQGGICLRGATRVSHMGMVATLTLGDYKKLKKLAQRDCMRITVLKERGIPFLFMRAMRRKGYVIGLALCLAAVFFASRFVFFVAVDGQMEEETRARIVQILYEQGVAPGKLKSAVDTNEAVRQVLLGVPELAFVNLRVNGVVAKAQGVLKIPAPQLLDPNVAAQVVAGKAGVVERITVLQGEAEVKPGQAVRPGDVLITGRLVYGTQEDPQVRLVHARGEVWARISYRGEAGQAVGLCDVKPTGRRTVKRYLELGGISLELDGGICDYDFYQVKRVSAPLGVPNGPRIVRYEYCELMTETVELPLEALMEAVRRQARAEAFAQMPADALPAGERTTFYMDGAGRLCAVVTVDALENIAQEVELGGY